MRYFYSSGTSLVPYLWAWFVWQPHLSTTCQGGVAISEHWSYDVLIFFSIQIACLKSFLNFILPKSKMKTFEHCYRVAERGSWYSCSRTKRFEIFDIIFFLLLYLIIFEILQKYLKTFEHCCRVPARGSWYSCSRTKRWKMCFLWVALTWIQHLKYIYLISLNLVPILMQPLHQNLR